MDHRKQRNRKRSKRRAIFCPIHGCHIDSVSQKHALYANEASQLRERGISRKNALMLMASHTTVALTGEWLEAFWCEECQQNEWYWVQRSPEGRYKLTTIPADLWKRAQGVILAGGNPTVSQFTRRQSRQTSYRGMKDFSELR